MGAGWVTTFRPPIFRRMPRPRGSNVNYAAGDVAPNEVLAKIGTGGTVCIYTKAETHILVDVAGYM